MFSHQNYCYSSAAIFLFSEINAAETSCEAVLHNVNTVMFKYLQYVDTVVTQLWLFSSDTFLLEV